MISCEILYIKGITMVDKEGTEKPSGQCRIESPATNHQIAGRP